MLVDKVCKLLEEHVAKYKGDEDMPVKINRTPYKYVIDVTRSTFVDDINGKYSVMLHITKDFNDGIRMMLNKSKS